MKVMFIGADVAVSGAGLSMITLAENLNRMGVETILVVSKGNAQRILEKQKRKHYTVTTRGWCIPNSGSNPKQYCIGIYKKLYNFIPYFRLKKIIKKENPDIIHINTITIYLGAEFALRYNKKLVWHVRELMEEGLGIRFFQKNRAKKLINKADSLISISRCVFDKYSRLFPNVPNVMIYNGVDSEKYKCENHTLFLCKTVTFTIAGRIGKNKGQYEALQGLTSLLKSDASIELQIAGNGNETELEKLKSYILDQNIPSEKVKFLGFVENMPSLWAKTDIAIVASKFEAFGRVTVEAMAAGCLVLGADTGGTDELIEDGVTGIKYHQGDPNSFSQKAEYILANKEKMKQIAAAGRKYALQNFTAERNAQQVKEVYLRLLQNNAKAVEEN